MSEPAPASPPFEHVLAGFGDISVTQHWVQFPSGSFAVQGTTWGVREHTRVEEHVSTTGIVLAVVFVWFCLLGLLFLLMKDHRTVHTVEVWVQGPGFHHATMLVATVETLDQAHRFAHYCRQLSAA